MAENRPDGPDLLRPSDNNNNGNGSEWKPAFTSQDSNVASFLQQHVSDLNEQSRDPAVGVKGSAPNFGQFPVPHVLSFQGLFGTFSRVYRPSDEAIKDSLENARYMRNDAGVMECVEARQRCTALLDWHLQPEDENSPEQIELVEQLTKILNRIERFTEYRYNLLHAVWYGRYAIQHRYRWGRIEGNMRVLPKGVRDNPGWIPVNGDKLVFRYDDGQPGNKPDQVGIRVGSRFQARDRINGRWNVEPTERGLAYFLEDWERGLLALHKHTLEDGSWEVGYEAGTIHGVGLRSRIYWDWFQKQEALAFLMEYLERSAGGIEIWHYPMGNAEAEAKARTAAEERIGNQRNIILVPKPMGDDAHAFGVEIVEPGMAGIDALQTILTDYYGHRIKRYILGQTLSSEAQATGLGSGLADLHLDTFLQIIKYDAVNLEETITHQLVKNIKDWNFPAAKDIHIEFKLDVEGTDTAEKLQAWQTAWQMGAKLKETDVMDLIGAATPTSDDRVLEMPEQGGEMGMEGMGGGPGPNGDPQASGIPTEDFDRRDDGPLPPDRDRDTDAVLSELFGEATSEGQTITYVSSNGKWMQQDMPYDTGERARGDRQIIDRNAKQGMLDFDEGDHPRDDSGKFTSGAGGPVPDSGDEPREPFFTPPGTTGQKGITEYPATSMPMDEYVDQADTMKEISKFYNEWHREHDDEFDETSDRGREATKALFEVFGKETVHSAVRAEVDSLSGQDYSPKRRATREDLERHWNAENGIPEGGKVVDIDLSGASTTDPDYIEKGKSHTLQKKLEQYAEEVENERKNLINEMGIDDLISLAKKHGVPASDWQEAVTMEAKKKVNKRPYHDIALGELGEGGKSDDDDAVVDMDSLTGEEFDEFQQLWKEENRYESGHGTALAGSGAKGFPSQEETAELMEKHGTSNPMDAWGQESMILASKKWRERKGGKSKNARPRFDEDEHPRDEDGKFSSTPVGTRRPDTDKPGDFWEKISDFDDPDNGDNPDAGEWKRRKGAKSVREELGGKRDRLKLRIDDKSRQKVVTRTVNNVLNSMSKRSRRRLNRNTSTIHFHDDPERMLSQLDFSAHPEGGPAPVSAFDSDQGTLHLVDVAGKGGAAASSLGKDEMMRQNYAHAMSHAIDGRHTGKRLSESESWSSAWEQDLSEGQLTDHGGRDEREGFAEFGRLMFVSDVPDERIAELFPNCHKYWKDERL